VFASSVLVFLPCPFSDFSSYLPSFGGRGICGTVSELRDGVEHKFSDLPCDEACLVLGSYFLRFLSASRCWMEEDHSHFCSVHWPSSISARVCLLLPSRDCWAGDRWVGVVCRPWLNRAGLHLFEVMCCYRARNSGMSLTWFRAKSSGKHVILQRTLQLDCQIGRP